MSETHSTLPGTLLVCPSCQHPYDVAIQLANGTHIGLFCFRHGLDYLYEATGQKFKVKDLDDHQLMERHHFQVRDLTEKLAEQGRRFQQVNTYLGERVEQHARLEELLMSLLEGSANAHTTYFAIELMEPGYPQHFTAVEKDLGAMPDEYLRMFGQVLYQRTNTILHGIEQRIPGFLASMRGA